MTFKVILAVGILASRMYLTPNLGLRLLGFSSHAPKVLSAECIGYASFVYLLCLQFSGAEEFTLESIVSYKLWMVKCTVYVDLWLQTVKTQSCTCVHESRHMTSYMVS